MDGMKFNIRSNNDDFEYHLSNNGKIVLEIENVNGELKISTSNNDTSHLNLKNESYDYLDLYEPDYMPERHKSSIGDVLNSRKEKARLVDREKSEQDTSSIMNREDIIDKYINKHSS
ncbi:hypothetical protein NGH46_12615 [Staphylococcus xylosus]|uniref:hypothetical protein n=1 Tax=Staphylococcus xylosus TaxID=1288 RepID=UPI002DB7C014|nr:hypothetical protein [Staphylococcus xylosus]MEB8122968.1 hypothetical protein [Staphylococcus xylosus]